MPTVRATSQPGFRLDFERDVVESSKMLKDDFEVDMKIAGQFVRSTDLECGIVGARFRQSERDRSVVNDYDLCLACSPPCYR
jgi:hypothetical protein